jgi:DNA polymerase-3 subunit beta
MGIKKKVKAQVFEEGSVLLPLKKISSLVRQLSVDSFFIEEKESDISLYGDNFEYNFFKLNPLDFPEFFDDKELFSISLPFPILKDMIKRTIFAVSNDELRYILNGVLFNTDKNTLTMVSTDGHRMACVKAKGMNGIDNEMDVVIPATTLSKVSQVVDCDKIKIKVCDNHVVFETNGVVIWSKIIKGKFPDYKKVIPKDFIGRKIKVKREDLLKSCQRLSVVVSQKNDTLIFNIKRNMVEISVSESDFGSAKEIVDIDYEGDDIEIGFKPKNFIDGLKNVYGEYFCLGIVGEDKMGVFLPIGLDFQDKEFVYLVMPKKKKG